MQNQQVEQFPEPVYPLLLHLSFLPMFTDQDPSVSLPQEDNGKGMIATKRDDSTALDCSGVLDWHNPGIMHFFEQFPTRITYGTGEGRTISDLKWSEARRIVLSRDRYRCRICSAHERAALTVHHIHPKGLGGGNYPANLITLCSKCHQDLCRRCHRSGERRVALGEAAITSCMNRSESGNKNRAEIPGIPYHLFER